MQASMEQYCSDLQTNNCEDSEISVSKACGTS